MSVQVLVATMYQTDHSLIEKMNINSDVIVGNQCNFNLIEKFEYNSHSVLYLNFNERGVGLNRNNSLMRASGEYCLFADDDMVYVDNYVELVENAFLKYPDADIIVFNLREKIPTRYIITEQHRIRWRNYLRYGTARIAFKLSSIRKNAIYFNQCFGGGTAHCHGEDSLFLTTCLKNGLKIYAIPEFIAELTEERASTWNTGYDYKYLIDQGYLYNTISKKWWKLLCLQDAIRHHSSYKMGWGKAYKIMTEGLH